MLALFLIFSLCLFTGSFIWLIIQFCKKQAKEKMYLPFISLMIGFIFSIIAIIKLPPVPSTTSSDTKISSETVQNNIEEETTKSSSVNTTTNAEPKQEIKSTKNVAEHYIGNRDDRTFHEPNCREAKKLTTANEVYFATRDEAIDAGYRPCKICRP